MESHKLALSFLLNQEAAQTKEIPSHWCWEYEAEDLKKTQQGEGDSHPRRKEREQRNQAKLVQQRLRIDPTRRKHPMKSKCRPSTYRYLDPSGMIFFKNMQPNYKPC